MRRTSSLCCQLLVSTLLFCAAFHCFAQRPIRQSDLAVFRDQQFPFTAYYPKTWARVETTHSATRFKVVSDNGDGDADFNVVVGFNPKLEQMSASEYADSGRKLSERMVQTLRQAIPDIRLVDHGITHLSNRQAYYLVSEGTYKYLNYEIPMRIFQIHALYEGNTYALTFRCPIEKYDELSPVFELMAATFTIRPTEKSIQQDRSRRRKN